MSKCFISICLIVKLFFMADYGMLINRLLDSSGVLQYPDKNLYNAALKLPAEERPTVPVRMTDDPSETYKLYDVLRSRMNPPIAFVAPDKKTIFVNSKSKEYKNPESLASKLAHEAHHMSNDVVGKANDNERGAALKEIEVLSRFKGGRHRDMIKTLKQLYGRE